MLPTRTKQINVYGKKSRRIIEAPPIEESIYDEPVYSAKSDRIPLIHRMKKRENNSTSVATKSKPTSPLRAVPLTKQRVIPKGSPARKDARRGTKLMEILAPEVTKCRVRAIGEQDLGNKRNILGTPTRMPLSMITTNTMNSPNAQAAAPKIRKNLTMSPKGLVTTKALSTVQVDIEVLDAKGRTVKQEQRVTRTDVVINKTTTGAKAPSVILGKQRRPSSRPPIPPVEIISIGSSVNEDDISDPDVVPRPPTTSSGSSLDSQFVGVKPRPTRGPKRVATRIVISDDSEDEDNDEPLISPHSPPAKQPRKSLAPSRKSFAATAKPPTTAPRLPPPSGLKMEVVVPPAPYKFSPASIKTAIPAPEPRSPPKRSQPVRDIEVHFAPKPRAKPDPLPASRTVAGSNQGQPRYPSYNMIPSPPFKPRSLTPIRNGRANTNRYSFARAPASPPSPTTPTDSDFDLSLEFSQFDIGLAPEDLKALQQPEKQAEYPEHLRPLLEECHQEHCGAYEFSAFIQTFPFDPILQDARRLAEKRREEFRFRKIGEASYSEVFGIGDVVLKVIPLRDESRRRGAPKEEEEEEDGPAPTDAKDVRKEIIVTRAMGEVHHRFVKLLKTYVVRGKYPEVLLNLWDEYHERKGSESIRPDTFTASQVYAIIVLPNGGPDLEAYTFVNSSKTGWRQASSLFWQVAKVLAHAEQLVSFEHRDLHWGQILVKDLPPTSKSVPLRSLTHALNQNQNKPITSQRVYMDNLAHGVEATIIDLGLSRMDAGDGSSGERVHWTPFDEEVFMGEGDYQFDVYRHMREHTAGDWEAFHPLTNVMWLHYLVTKLLRHKNLKPPSTTRKSHAVVATAVGQQPQDAAFPYPSVPSRLDPASQFTEKDCYDALVDVEEWLGRCIVDIAQAVASRQKTKARGRTRKTAVVIKPIGGLEACACAGEVVGYGVKRGWIRAVS